MMALWVGVLIWYIWAMAPWEWSLHSVSAPLKPLIWVTAMLIVGSIIVQTVLGARQPDEAAAAADEREQAILDRAGRWSGWVLGFLVVTSLLHYLQHGHGDLLFHTLFLSLILSSVAEQAGQILLLRRGI
jgi:hypothetical protein